MFIVQILSSVVLKIFGDNFFHHEKRIASSVFALPSRSNLLQTSLAPSPVSGATGPPPNPPRGASP